MTQRFTLSIDTENAAFDPVDNGQTFEVARILRDLAARLEAGECDNLDQGRLRDLNGNTVGRWWFDRRHVSSLTMTD